MNKGENQMKFRAIVATTNMDLHGEVLSEDALRKFAEDAPGKSVMVDWQHEIGTIDGARVENGKLVVTGEILSGAFAVPSFFINKDGERELWSIGITKTPADPNIAPIEANDDD